MELDRVHAHGIDQTRGWRDMVAARDRQIVQLEDKLSRIAGGSDDAKLAAAQVLVRKLHEMRREEEERMTLKVEEARNESENSLGMTNLKGTNNTHADVLQARIVALQNELRQMQEEGSVSSTVAARQAARAAQQEAAAATIHAKSLEMRLKQMRKNSP